MEKWEHKGNRLPNERASFDNFLSKVRWNPPESAFSGFPTSLLKMSPNLLEHLKIKLLIN